MTLFILHNPHDLASREFVAAHGGDHDVKVFDWTDDDDRDEWIALGGTLAIGAFPAVVLRSPEHAVDVIGEVPGGPNGGWRTERRHRGEDWEVISLPDGIGPDGSVASIATALSRQASLEALAAVTWAEAVACEEPSALPQEVAKAEVFVEAVEALAATNAEDADVRGVVEAQVRDRMDAMAAADVVLPALEAVYQVESKYDADETPPSPQVEDAEEKIKAVEERGHPIATELRERLDVAPNRRPK